MKDKQDAEKLRFGLLPWAALRLVTRVLEFGARKYEDDGWRKQENAIQRYREAALRHLIADMEGELLDPESGEPTLAHAAADLLFVLDLRSKVKEQTVTLRTPTTASRSFSIPREILATLSAEELEAVIEDTRAGWL